MCHKYLQSTDLSCSFMFYLWRWNEMDVKTLFYQFWSRRGKKKCAQFPAIWQGALGARSCNAGNAWRKKKHQRLRCCTSCTPFGFQMIQQKWQHVPSSKVLQKWICLKMGHTVVYSQIAIQQERKYGKLMSNHDQPTDSAWSWRVSRVNRSILSSGLRAQLGARDRTNAFAKALNGSITVGMAMGNPKYPWFMRNHP